MVKVESTPVWLIHAFICSSSGAIIVAGVEEDLVAADHPGLFKSCMLFCRALLDVEMLSGCSRERVELVNEGG